jgi:DNA-directed RNA polymerase subunit RPC12/RpoP
MCELLVGLPEVIVLGLVDQPGQPLEVHIEQAGHRLACLGCGSRPLAKDRDLVELAGLPCFGRQVRLMWRKVRWACLDPDCTLTTWTWADPRIAAPRQAITDRAARWVTVHVGRLGRPVA